MGLIYRLIMSSVVHAFKEARLHTELMKVVMRCARSLISSANKITMRRAANVNVNTRQPDRDKMYRGVSR